MDESDGFLEIIVKCEVNEEIGFLFELVDVIGMLLIYEIVMLFVVILIVVCVSELF